MKNLLNKIIMNKQIEQLIETLRSLIGKQNADSGTIRLSGTSEIVADLSGIVVISDVTFSASEPQSSQYADLSTFTGPFIAGMYIPGNYQSVTLGGGEAIGILRQKT